MSDDVQHATKEDVDTLHKRIDQVEAFLERVLHKVEGFIGSASQAAAGVVRVVAPEVAAAVAGIAGELCPDHEGPLVNGACTVPGCEHGPTVKR